MSDGRRSSRRGGGNNTSSTPPSSTRASRNTPSISSDISLDSGSHATGPAENVLSAGQGQSHNSTNQGTPGSSRGASRRASQQAPKQSTAQKQVDVPSAPATNPSTSEAQPSTEMTDASSVTGQASGIPSQEVEQLFQEYSSHGPIVSELNQFLEGAHSKLENEIPPAVLQAVKHWVDNLEEHKKEVQASYEQAVSVAERLRNGKDAFYQQKEVQEVAEFLKVVKRMRANIQGWSQEFGIQLPSTTAGQGQPTGPSASIETGAQGPTGSQGNSAISLTGPIGSQ